MIQHVVRNTSGLVDLLHPCVYGLVLRFEQWKHVLCYEAVNAHRPQLSVIPW